MGHFQARIDDALEWLHGVINISDDIMLFSENEEEHAWW